MITPMKGFTMKKLGICIIALGMTVMTYAQEGKGLYVSGKFAFFTGDAKWSGKANDGFFFTDGDTGKASNNLSGFTAALGYRFSPKFRCEGEFAYATKGSTDLMTFMGQLYGDIPIKNCPLTPYLNVGIGGVQYASDDHFQHGSGGSKNLSSVCWNMGVGCSLAVTGGLSIDASYRYFQTGAMKYTVDFYGASAAECDIKLNSSVFLAGLRYAF